MTECRPLTLWRYRLTSLSKCVETFKKPPVSNGASGRLVRSSSIVSVQVQELLTFAAEVIPDGEVRNVCGVTCRGINRILG